MLVSFYSSSSSSFWSWSSSFRVQFNMSELLSWVNHSQNHFWFSYFCYSYSYGLLFINQNTNRNIQTLFLFFLFLFFIISLCLTYFLIISFVSCSTNQSIRWMQEEVSSWWVFFLFSSSLFCLFVPFNRMVQVWVWQTNSFFQYKVEPDFLSIHIIDHSIDDYELLRSSVIPREIKGF